MESSYSSSPHYALDAFHTPSLIRSSMPPEAFTEEQAAASLKVSKLLRILRRWKALSRTQAAAAAVSRRSAARSSSSSRLTLAPLRCISMPLHESDDEDEEENGAMLDKPFATNWSCRSPRFGASHRRGLPIRALSCPKITSPLSSCTPFSIDGQNGRGDDDLHDEVLECLQPYSTIAKHEESSGIAINSKGSSPLKLNLSKQPSTPRGYLALYVGEERKRFLVKASVVNHPLFGVLLEKAKEEFGFQQKGPLNIPCEIAFFQHIMLLVEANDPFYRNADQSTILLHLNNHMATTTVM